MVLKDGAKMSKSKGNAVDPDDVIARYGADALRAFMAFAAPIEKEIDWIGFEGIEGASRFLRRVTRLVDDYCEQDTDGENNIREPRDGFVPEGGVWNSEEKLLLHKLNVAIKRITDDLEVRYQFNTVVSSLMELANDISALPADAPRRSEIMGCALSVFVRLMSPVAPHLAEQLWEQLGGKGFCMNSSWPEYETAWLETDEQLVVVQINGKVRGRVTVKSSADDEERKGAALACPEARAHLIGKEIRKVIVVPGGKLVSIVV